MTDPKPRDLSRLGRKKVSPKLTEKLYDIVLAIRTEGVIHGKTKYFAEVDTEDIEALYAPVIEQAVKAEHDSMIKCCVDEGNDAYKRGVDKERERIYKLWREDTNDGEVPTSLGFSQALKGEVD